MQLSTTAAATSAPCTFVRGRVPSTVSTAPPRHYSSTRGLNRTIAANTTVESLLHLLKAVRCHDPNVQRVCIENKRLPAKYITAFFLALVENKYVTKVQLSRVGADDTVAWAVAACIRNNMSIAQLDLSHNKFSDKGCRQIAQAMQEAGAQSMLRRLNLERNCIGDEGIDQLCRALPYMSSLTVVKLGNNMFGVMGLRSIATLLKSTSSLQSLDLRCNQMGYQGACIIADALSHNKSLLYLYLNRNNLDNRGVGCLAAALTRNQHLRTLDLQRNDFDDTGAAAFVQVLGKNDSFIRLKIRHTAVSESVKAELLELLIMNSYGPDLARRTKLAMAQWQLGDDQDTSLEQLDKSTSSAIEEEEEQTECVICFDKISDCALLPCQHCNCCLDCGKRLKGCHMCRSAIVKVLPLEPGRRAVSRTLLDSR